MLRCLRFSGVVSKIAVSIAHEHNNTPIVQHCLEVIVLNIAGEWRIL